ncbi:glycoprotein [Leishmania martiniquensis leishbunyavirus 1]|uniref:Glycoprotein n=1 Tax=Leishmania martiniquensis leishbunyavirus 1 TaxID=2696682 RepID=A0A7U3MF33_9VIRU|nr:glycoprotein [Leishmania martiniquensis leishbunyavirus 1]
MRFISLLLLFELIVLTSQVNGHFYKFYYKSFNSNATNGFSSNVISTPSFCFDYTRSDMKVFKIKNYVKVFRTNEAWDTSKSLVFHQPNVILGKIKDITTCSNYNRESFIQLARDLDDGFVPWEGYTSIHNPITPSMIMQAATGDLLKVVIKVSLKVLWSRYISKKLPSKSKQDWPEIRRSQCDSIGFGNSQLRMWYPSRATDHYNLYIDKDTFIVSSKISYGHTVTLLTCRNFKDENITLSGRVVYLRTNIYQRCILAGERLEYFDDFVAHHRRLSQSGIVLNDGYQGQKQANFRYISTPTIILALGTGERDQVRAMQDCLENRNEGTWLYSFQ